MIKAKLSDEVINDLYINECCLFVQVQDILLEMWWNINDVRVIKMNDFMFWYDKEINRSTIGVVVT